MIHLLAELDHRGSTGHTAWHRASALGKLLLTAGIVGVAIAAKSLTLQIAVLVLVLVMLATAGIGAALAAAAAVAPLLFSVLYAVALWDGSIAHTATLLLRPVITSLAAVWLIGTTPYPDVFAPLSRLLPRATGDGLFLTYRALFALLWRGERLRQGLKLRGGLSGPWRRRAGLAGEGLGTLVVHGFERSQRLYATMLLRGHSGRICGCRHFAEGSRSDLLVALAGAALAGLVVWGWRAP